MKVFVPMSDELLNQEGTAGRLVPFNPAFLESSHRPGHRPPNWISSSDYEAACERLRESQVEREFSTV